MVTTTDTWLLHRLGAGYVTDAATASRTMLLDLDRAAWSEAACAAFGVDPAGLPTVADCAGVVGETSCFGPALPVAGIAVDQQAALLAQGCLAAGDAKCTYGTGAFLLVTTGSAAVRSSAGLSASVAWRLGGAATYCLDGQVYTAGSALRWLTDIGVLGSPAELDAVGGTVPDAGGVTFVPALAGLGAPHWAPDARGLLAGLHLATSPGHLARAVAEGIAASVALLVSAACADLGRPLTSLRVDGGLTRSRLLMQAQADLLQVPVLVCRSPDATALGVAALARLGIGDAAPPPRPWGRLRWKRSWTRRSPRIRRPNGSRFSAPPSTSRCPGDDAGGRRRDHRRRRGRHRDRAHAGAATRSTASWSTRPATSAPARPRPTPRSCTPGSTPSRAPWRAGCSAGAARCCASTPPPPGSRWSGPGRCSSPGPPSRPAALPAIAENARRNGYHASVRSAGRRAVRAGAGPRTGGARRAVDPRREHHLPVDDAARVRDRGGRRGRAAAARDAGHRRRRPPATASSSTRRAGRCGCRWAVNAAGLASDKVDRMFGGDGFTIRPRQGELIVFDKLARPLLSSILLPVPTARTKGVLVAPTVFGNVLLGPTARGRTGPRRTRPTTARRAGGAAGRRAADPAGAGRGGGDRDVRGTAGRDRALGLPGRGRGRAVRARRPGSGRPG